MRHTSCRALRWLPLPLLAMACSLTTVGMPEGSQPTATAGSASLPTPTATPPQLHLGERPQLWFGPLPPLLEDEGRPFIGAEDFMDLFVEDAPWANTAQQVDVFLLYGEWLLDDSWTVHASEAELEQVVSDLNRRGIAIAVELSPLTYPETCGTGIESWGGPQAGLRIARRVQAAGGTISFFAMDAPFAYASFPHGPGACEWSAEEVAGRIAAFADAVSTIFPEVVVGDTEPLWRDFVDDSTYKDWMATFRQVTGQELPFFHLDIDYSGRSDWPDATKELETYARQRGVEFGIFYLGSEFDVSDEAWLAKAGQRALVYEDQFGGQLDHVLFQSWNDHPDYALPESGPDTYTNLILNYTANRDALGFRTQGPGAVLTLGRPAAASAALPGFEAEQAVDGDPGTWWGAGAPPPQWIEIDLGAPHAIAGIRLRVSQSPPGPTEHQVLGRGPSTGGANILLHAFSGDTADLDEMAYSPPQPWQGIQFVRIQTVSSPSWVSWREIWVIAARE